MTDRKKSFILYTDYRQHLEILTDEERGQLLTALFDYAEGTDPEGLAGVVRVAFSFIRAQMDRDNEKYMVVCERNRTNGAKGGRPAKAKETQTNPEEPREPSGFFGNPEEPNENPSKPRKPDTDTDTENDNDTDNDIDTDTDIITPTAPSAGKQQPVPYEKIRQLFNEICVSYSTVINIEGQRRKAVAARWKTYKDLDTFRTLFQKAEASSFLKGQNDRNWMADFDWITKPTNMAKVLEGKYDDKGGKRHETNKQQTEQAPSEWMSRYAAGYTGDDE